MGKKAIVEQATNSESSQLRILMMMRVVEEEQQVFINPTPGKFCIITATMQLKILLELKMNKK